MLDLWLDGWVYRGVELGFGMGLVYGAARCIFILMSIYSDFTAQRIGVYVAVV